MLNEDARGNLLGLAARDAHEAIAQARETALLRYVRTARAAGYSMRTALAAFRGAGGMIRTEDFSQLWAGLSLFPQCGLNHEHDSSCFRDA